MAIASPFPSPNFQPMIPALVGSGLVPAALYKAKFYDAGTDIPKTIYTDADLAVPYANPANIAFLDDEGKALIYLGAGGYKLVLTDPNDNPVAGWTIDNIVGAGSFSTGFADNFEALEDVNTTLNKYTYIPGYYTAGDGGHGMFYNETSSDSTDGGYIQFSDFDNTKRWFRIPDEDGDVRAASFGFCGSGDLTNNILAADAYAATIGARLRIQTNTARYINTSITLNTNIVPDNYAYLESSNGSSITCAGIVEAGDWEVFVGFGSVSLANPTQVSRPEWFGASLSGTGGDNATAFTKWKAAGAGLFVVPPGTWAHTGAFTPVSNRITVFNGSVGSRVPGTFYGPASMISGDVEIDTDGNISAANITAATDVNTGNLFATGTVQGEQIFSNTSIDATQNVTAGGFMAATGAVSAGTTVTGGGEVRAGNSGEGHLVARAGTSLATTFRAGGPGQVIVGTGACALAANAVTGLYGYITIKGSGTIASSMTGLSVKVGSNDVFTWPGTTTNATNYRFEVQVFRTGATTSYSSGFITFDDLAGNPQAFSDVQSAAITWANSNAVSQTPTGGVVSMTMYEFGPYDGT